MQVDAYKGVYIYTFRLNRCKNNCWMNGDVWMCSESLNIAITHIRASTAAALSSIWFNHTFCLLCPTPDPRPLIWGEILCTGSESKQRPHATIATTRRFGLMPHNYALNSIISICICTINENMFLYLCFSYLHFPMVTPHAVTVFGLTINNSALKNNLQPDCFWKMKNPQLFVFFTLSSHCHWPLAGCPK